MLYAFKHFPAFAYFHKSISDDIGILLLLLLYIYQQAQPIYIWFVSILFPYIKMYSTFRLFNSIWVLLIIINIQILRFWNDINLFSLIFHRMKRRLYECYFSRFKLNYISLLLWTIASIFNPVWPKHSFKFIESLFWSLFSIIQRKTQAKWIYLFVVMLKMSNFIAWIETEGDSLVE